MSTLFEFPALIDAVNTALDAMNPNGSADKFSAQGECELYDKTGPLTLAELPPELSKVVSRIRDSRNSDLIPHYQRFQKLWAGNWQDLYPSQSEADVAFCGLLARKGLDSLEIDMTVRASGLYREKWERIDYRRRTIIGVMPDTKTGIPSESNQDKSSKTDWVTEMNERYAVVRVGTDVVIMDFKTPQAGFQGAECAPEPMKFTTFKALLAGQFIGATDGKAAHKAAAWLTHAGRRQYEGVSYAPGQALAPKLLNLWQGFPVKPNAGDVSLWLELLEGLIPDKTLANWCVKWLAWRVQNLHQVPGTVLIFQGKKGTGKNSLFEPIVNFFGCHAMVADDPELIIGRFNWHLMNQSFVVLDEAVFAGDRRQADKLKSRITATQMTYEAKGMTPVIGTNRCAYVMLTNHEHVWQASLDERRAVVITVANKLRGNNDFWMEYYEWCRNHGPSSLLAHLLALNVQAFNPREIPSGTAIEDQIALTALRDPATAWWHQCLSEGSVRWFDGNLTRVVDFESDKSTSVDRSGLRLSYEQSAGVRGKHSVAWDVVAKRLRHWCKPHEIKESRKTVPYGPRMREDIFPSLAELQDAFTEATGLNF